MEFKVGDLVKIEGRIEEVVDIINLNRQSEIYHDALKRVSTLFKGDLEKAKLWMKTANPNLGGYTPIFLIQRDRGDKLLKYIEAAEQGF